jgi:DNA-directed RNA polymerase subunit N (RpoN/RPB10)
MEILEESKAAGKVDNQLEMGQALDEIELKRYCCRRMVLTHVDLIVKLLSYNSKSISNPSLRALRGGRGIS